ncbi:ABC transporter substrate-binding protein, partial [Candidatus Kuenenbacteria bacterium CG23_combo_of_CG06-09_8_20_14_all_36_9]
QILGLPLSLDTLTLFYNRDHFNAAGLIQAPSTWQEFNEAVIK